MTATNDFHDKWRCQLYTHLKSYSNFIFADIFDRTCRIRTISLIIVIFGGLYLTPYRWLSLSTIVLWNLRKNSYHIYTLLYTYSIPSIWKFLFGIFITKLIQNTAAKLIKTSSNQRRVKNNLLLHTKPSKFG